MVKKMSKNRSKIYDLTLMAICLALMIVGAKLAIPIGPIPVTFQTLAVFIISLVLGTKRAAIVFTIYIILGLIGLPVFSTGGGIQYIYMPSFGFVVGFLLASLVIGLEPRFNKFYAKYILSFIGLIIINVCGLSYMFVVFNLYKGLNKDFIYVIQVGLLPFITKDIFMVILACIIYSRLKIVLHREEKEEIILINDERV